MLDRTKLKKVGTKGVRAVIDEDYKEMLIGKLLLLGCRYKNHSYREVIAAPKTKPIGSKIILMWRDKKAHTHWRIQTKNVHDILTHWSKPHE